MPTFSRQRRVGEEPDDAESKLESDEHHVAALAHKQVLIA